MKFQAGDEVADARKPRLSAGKDNGGQKITREGNRDTRGNAKSIHACINAKKEENLSSCYKCQAQLPNCWIGDFKSFGKNNNAKPICKTVGVALNALFVGAAGQPPL
jgi:hypothetical protein